MIEKGVEVRGGTVAVGINLGEVYGGQNTGLNEGVLKVRRKDYEKARGILEEEIGSTPLPDDHYLHGYSDKELVDLLVEPDSWGAFEVGHAKRIATERKLNWEAIKRVSDGVNQRKQKGRVASRKLVSLGWCAALAGGVVGVGIGWSLAFMEEKTPSGTYPTYDEPSRETGKKMMTVGVLMSLVWFRWDFFKQFFES